MKLIGKSATKTLQGWLWIFPAATLLLIFTIIPIFQGMYLSFYDAGIRHKEFIGLGNFIHLFTGERFWAALRNTIKYVIVAVPSIVLLSLSISLVASKMNKSGQQFIKFAYYLPCLAAGVVMSIIWKWIFRVDSGLLNAIIGKPIIWLGANPMAFWSVCIVVVTGGLGVNIIIYMASIASIDRELYDAAMVDGANKFQQSLHITIPLLLPITAFLLIVGTIGMFQIWNVIWMLTRGGPGYGTISLVFDIYQLGIHLGRFGLAAAESFVLLFIILIFSSVQFFLFTKKAI